MERERKLLICYWTIYSVMFVFKFEVIQLVSDGTRTWTSELHIPFSILYCPHKDPWKEPLRKRSGGNVIITSTMIITTIYWFYFVSHVEQLPGVLRILKGRNHITCLKRAYSLIENFVLYKNFGHNQYSLVYLWGRKGAAFSEVVIKERRWIWKQKTCR